MWYLIKGKSVIDLEVVWDIEKVLIWFLEEEIESFGFWFRIDLERVFLILI